ncbi:DUF6703 family protein [Melissospora conviva]|uniref:DUF6703 family protein n=1 Tax=Melissospora conviva TaxID=3388432 RepID=UPI003B7704D8
MQRTQSAWELRLARLNPTSVFLAALALMLAALFAPGLAGALLLLVLAAALGLLMSKTWPVQTAGTRAVRLSVLALLVAGAVAKLL